MESQVKNKEIKIKYKCNVNSNSEQLFCEKTNVHYQYQ